MKSGSNWRWALTMRGLEALPKNAVSRAFGALADLRFPEPIQARLNAGFARLYGLDVEEAEREPGAYRSLNAFFTRGLRPGARPIEALGDPRALTSPVDGLLTERGASAAGPLIQAKGRTYSLVELLDSAEEAERFGDGAWATIYLSPRDYHRIHAPAAGRLVKLSYIPGHLWPVNALSVARVDRLFAVNERLISYLETPALGRLAVVKVGATCVGRIGASHDTIESNRARRRRREIEYAEPIEIERGQEIGVFNLGSTVIVLTERGPLSWQDEAAPGHAVRLGQRIAELAP